MNPEPNPGEKKFWFPAKKYGWGWGPPNCWQGWLVVIIYIGLAVTGAILINPGKHLLFFIGYMVVLVALLCIVAWLKGEKPHWRWGEK